MNVPKLRFKEFDGEWEEKDFEELLEAKDGIRRGPFGSALKKEFFVPESDYVVYEQQNAIYDKYTTRYNITKDKYEELIKFSLKPGDFIMSGAGTIGRISKVPKGIKKGVFNQALIRFRINSEITDSEYFLQFIRAEKMQRKLTGANPGSAITNLVPMSELKKWSIITPNIKEQQKISKFLKTVDKKIQLQQQKIDLLQEQKKGYMQKVFNQEIRFKDGGHYYMKWAEYILNDLGETYTGLSGKTKEDFGVGEHSFVTYVNVFKNLFAKKFGVEKVIFKENENQNYVKTDDLFFTTSSETPKEVGMASIWKHESCNLHLNSFCFGYRVTNPKILPDFLAISLRSEYMRKKITILAQGSTRYNISKTELMKEKVNVPCLEEQKRIVEFYLKLDTSIELEKKKLDILKEQKQGFMQQMFI